MHAIYFRIFLQFFIPDLPIFQPSRMHFCGKFVKTQLVSMLFCHVLLVIPILPTKKNLRLRIFLCRPSNVSPACSDVSKSAPPRGVETKAILVEVYINVYEKHRNIISLYHIYMYQENMYIVFILESFDYSLFTSIFLYEYLLTYHNRHSYDLPLRGKTWYLHKGQLFSFIRNFDLYIFVIQLWQSLQVTILDMQTNNSKTAVLNFLGRSKASWNKHK